MKFDVVIGNPPYQTGNGEKGGRHAMWRKFVKTSFKVVKLENGVVALVCPAFPWKSNDLGSELANNTPLWLKNDVSKYFNVGSNISAWVVKTGNSGEKFIVDDAEFVGEFSIFNDPTRSIIERNILNKISGYDMFECKMDKGYSSTQLPNDDNDYFCSPEGDSIYPIRHASKIKVCYVSSPTMCAKVNKVMMTFSGNPAYKYYNKKDNMSSCYQMSGYIEVPNKTHGMNLISLYETRLYKFLSNLFSTGCGMKGKNNYNLPRLDITQAWTSEMVYSYFALSKEEISCVESTIK